MNSNTFYVTTPIYYVNDVPHVGHLYTTLAADVLARYHKALGDSVFFLTGTDEHGAKIAEAAEAAGVSPQEYADKTAPHFKEAWKLFDIDYDHFFRTTDQRHIEAVQTVLQKIYDAGYIYKGEYEGWYCIGCEKYLTEKEMIEGKCPDHPTKEPTYQKEENYFFKLSAFKDDLLKALDTGTYGILPESRRNEIVSKLKLGVEDISISRENLDWGIPCPWDETHSIYVWVEALFNYYTATRFLEGKEKFWPADVHLMAKDITWFHAVIWEALLMAANLDLPKTIFAHGFFTLNGSKMSKSTGNVISPHELADAFGVEASRYLLLAEIPFGADANLSLERFRERYQADLANGLGNLVQRVATLCERSKFGFEKDTPPGFKSQVKDAMNEYRFDKALEEIWQIVRMLDKRIDETQPWTLTGKELKSTLMELVAHLRQVGYELQPFMPETAQALLTTFEGPFIKAPTPLFPRLD